MLLSDPTSPLRPRCCLTLTIALLFGLAACGSDDGDGGDSGNGSCSGANFVNSGQTNGGCGDLTSGVSAGGDCCESACGQVCCTCSGSAAGYRASLCQDDGTCADATSACQSALQDNPAYCQ